MARRRFSSVLLRINVTRVSLICWQGERARVSKINRVLFFHLISSRINSVLFWYEVFLWFFRLSSRVPVGRQVFVKRSLFIKSSQLFSRSKEICWRTCHLLIVLAYYLCAGSLFSLSLFFFSLILAHSPRRELVAVFNSIILFAITFSSCLDEELGVGIGIHATLFRVFQLPAMRNCFPALQTRVPYRLRCRRLLKKGIQMK